MDLTNDSLVSNNQLTPTEFYLSKNYPNPFGGKTSIKYCIAYRTRVLMQIFNIWEQINIDRDWIIK